MRFLNRHAGSVGLPLYGKSLEESSQGKSNRLRVLIRLSVEVLRLPLMGERLRTVGGPAVVLRLFRAENALDC